MKHKEIKLTEFEKAILSNIPKEFKYIARDKYGDLWIYKEKPTKGNIGWRDNGRDMEDIPLSRLFHFIKWEDEEPYLIDDLLK